MITTKKYKCRECDYVQQMGTNHYGHCYSLGSFNACPVCPPYKRPTVWVCQEQPPDGEVIPEPWAIAKLGDLVTVNPEDLVELIHPRPYDSEKDFTLLLEACKKAGTRYIGPIREAFEKAGIDFPEYGEVNTQLDQDIDKAWRMLGYTK